MKRPITRRVYHVSEVGNALRFFKMIVRELNDRIAIEEFADDLTRIEKHFGELKAAMAFDYERENRP